MLISSFFKTNKIYENAVDFTAVYHKVDSSVVSDFIVETGRWFSILNSDDDDATRQIRLKLWDIRSSVIESLLNFDDENLKLSLNIKDLNRISQYNPNLGERIESLSTIADVMLNNPINPKKEAVFQLLKASGNSGKGIAVIASTSRMSALQLNQALIKEIRQIAPECRLIHNRRMLMELTYKNVILPSGGKYCPFINQLYFGYMSKQLDIIYYQKERVLRPERTPLPAGSIAFTGTVKPVFYQQDYSDENEKRVDTWVQKQYWESLRGSTHMQLVTATNERDRNFFVKSRLILLGDGSKTFLQDDSHVIEISDLIEGRIDIQKIGRRFPRRTVNQLKEGDLIVLRTSGSGDYLLDVAKSLMAKDDKSDLLETALSWKKVLKKGLEDYGTELIAQRLSKKGFSINNHRYIWMWTTDQVIRPKSINIFFELIAILDDLDCSIEYSDLMSMAEIWWQQMKEIIRYHMRAGQDIRNSLLHRLSKIIKDQIVITDSYRMTLPDVKSGELSVFRVMAVDSQTIDLPYYHSGSIIHSDNSWE